MKYKDFKYYKPTWWDKFQIEGCGILFVTLLFAGIWYDDYRWKLIFSAFCCLGWALVCVLVIDNNEKEFEKRAKPIGVVSLG